MKPLFAWYDFWMGAYYDRNMRSLYVLPLPMIGLRIDFSTPCATCGKHLYRDSVCYYAGISMCYACKWKEEYFDEEYA